MDNHVWLTEGNWFGFRGTVNKDVQEPYLVCPLHTEEAWKKYEEEKKKKEEEEAKATEPSEEDSGTTASENP